MLDRLERVGGLKASILAFDSYYYDLSHKTPEQRRLVNYDHPDSLDDKLFVEHLDLLRSGHLAPVPVYDFATHTRRPWSDPMAPAQVVLVEGLLLLAIPNIKSRLDFSVFLDVPEHERLRRRILRDTLERGRDADDVRRQFASTVAPMHKRFVQPSRRRVDRVVGYEESLEAVADELLEVLEVRSMPVLEPFQLVLPGTF